MNDIDTDDEKLRFIYEHIPIEDQLYESYDEFLKAIANHDEKSMKQYDILEERIQRAQKINDLIEKYDLESRCMKKAKNK